MKNKCLLIVNLLLCATLFWACKDKETPEPPITFTLSFETKDNPEALMRKVETTTLLNTISVESPFIGSPNLVASFKTNAKQVLVNGVEQKSGVTVNDFSSPVTYTVISERGTKKEYIVDVTYSGLPVVLINTPRVPIPSKFEDWMEGASLTIYNPDGSLDYMGTTQIRGRGNTTWSMPKKPYALKLNEKAEILGMPKHKRWVLLANWMDRTLLRNRTSFQIAASTGLAWTPNGEFVEVILNGEHVGNYYLCEQIKVDKNRVNISELDEEATSGEGITGGYLMELDVNYDEVNKFMSQYGNFPYMFKDPDEVNAEQFAYMQDYVNRMEATLYDDEQLQAGKFTEFLDMDSFIDWWLVHELAQNGEPGHPKSTYMYKDKNGKLFAGPAWDFDWGTYRIETANGYRLKSSVYYPQLFKNAAFVARVKERWTMLKPAFDKIPAFIESEARRIASSEKMNHKLWPITMVENKDEHLSFEEAVQRMRSAYETKLAWLDKAIKGM